MNIRRTLLQGLVIPAHPLALNSRRRLDERRQRALTRYYLDAGAGGLAVGVHTTQFAIHRPETGLLGPVLELAIETSRGWRPRNPPVMIAGVIGSTRQAVAESRLARDLGYDAALLSLAAFPHASDAVLLEHVRSVAGVIPVMGFYLQPAVGGRELNYRFWREFAEIKRVVAIKIAPFDRYRTLDVVRAVIDAGRHRDIALYTGNDDHIVMDLLTRCPDDRGADVGMIGGLLGHWAVWTRSAVKQHAQCVRAVRKKRIPGRMLKLASEITDANGAIFDAAHGFRGCLPGIHEVLRRQGLLAGRWCLDPDEELSPGQGAEIARVSDAYPHLADDSFVRARLDRWMR